MAITHTAESFARQGKSLMNSALHGLRGVRARRVARGLTEHPDDRVAAVGRAIVANLSSSRQRSLASAPIERRRRALNRRTDTVTVPDLWAPDPSKVPESTLSVSRLSYASKPPYWAGLLYELVREWVPTSVVELGTCVGISASYQAAALREVGGGRIVSLEGAPELARLSRETFGELGFDVEVVTGQFADTLVPALEAAQPVDLLFNDGHHDGDAVMRYFEQAIPHLAGEAVMVLDDIRWSDSMLDAWQALIADDRIRHSFDLGAMGIVMLGGDGEPVVCSVTL